MDRIGSTYILLDRQDLPSLYPTHHEVDITDNKTLLWLLMLPMQAAFQALAATDSWQDCRCSDTAAVAGRQEQLHNCAFSIRNLGYVNDHAWQGCPHVAGCN